VCTAPSGARAILTPSGTEAELIVLALASSRSPRPLLNIVVAPHETGSGVLLAASGRHFLGSASLGDEVAKGALLAGIESRDIAVETIDIRDSCGAPRAAASIDAEAATRVRRALKKNWDVLLHVLDCSKTGLSGVSRSTATALRAEGAGRVDIVVDACQLRCPPAMIRADLEAGFLVTVTGSKFAGGPPFCGAVLVPADLAGAVHASRPPPLGLSAYSAYFDWPDDLRPWVGRRLAAPANLGLGLRWRAALAELQAFHAAPRIVTAACFAAFSAHVRAQAKQRPWMSLGPPAPRQTDRDETIIPITLRAADGDWLSPADTAAIHVALRDGDEKCHLGQPVVLGAQTAVRFCASASMAAGFAERIASGSAQAAFEPICGAIDRVFGKLDRVYAQQCSRDPVMGAQDETDPWTIRAQSRP